MQLQCIQCFLLMDLCSKCLLIFFQGIFDSLGYSDSAPDYSAKLTEVL